jgi:hypothetical protein
LSVHGVCACGELPEAWLGLLLFSALNIEYSVNVPIPSDAIDKNNDILNSFFLKFIASAMFSGVDVVIDVLYVNNPYNIADNTVIISSMFFIELKRMSFPIICEKSFTFSDAVMHNISEKNNKSGELVMCSNVNLSARYLDSIDIINGSIAKNILNVNHFISRLFMWM